MISFWQQLRTRKIVQWALAYLAGAWLVLQLLSLLAQPFAWPDLVLRAAVVLLAVGFFGTLVIAWYHGEKGAQRVTGPELAMIAGILVIAAVGVTFLSRSGQEPRQGAEAAASPALATGTGLRTFGTERTTPAISHRIQRKTHGAPAHPSP